MAGVHRVTVGEEGRQDAAYPQAISTSLTGTITPGQLALVDATAGTANWTISMSAAKAGAGAVVGAKKVDTTANPVNILPAAGDTINTAASQRQLVFAGEACELVSDGISKWVVRSSDTPAAVLNNTYGRKDAAGQGAASLLRIPRNPIRLSEYRFAATRPTITGVGSTGISNPVNVTLTTDGYSVGPSASVNAWGGLTYTANAYGIGFVGANNAKMTLEFATDSPLFAVKGTTGHTAMQVLCNGEIIYDDTDGPSSGIGSYHLFNWNGDRYVRRYVIRSSGYAAQLIQLGAGDSIYAPKDYLGPKVAWVGDSYSSNGSRTGFDDFPTMVGGLLGWKRMAIDAQGGSGYAQDNSGAVQTFLARVPNVIASAPDVVVYAGGHNKAPGEDLSVSVPAVLTATRAGLPSVPIVVIAPFSPSSTYETSNAADWTKMQAACAAYSNVYFVDTRGWVTGTGKSGSPANDGNADNITSSDGTHYTTTIGAEWIAVRTADAISALI